MCYNENRGLFLVYISSKASSCTFILKGDFEMGKFLSGSRIFCRTHGDALTDFIYRAQLHGYSNPDAKFIENGDGTFSVMPFVDGDWRYTDTWAGGEPFSGMSTVWYRDVVCWSMVYWGRVMPLPDQNYHGVTEFLSEALRHAKPIHPWRGPNKFVATCKIYPNARLGDDLIYRNDWKGNIRRFSGEETIIRARDKALLYTASYMGGVVNQDLRVDGKNSQPVVLNRPYKKL